MVPLFAYWDIRGMGQPVRLLLEYTDTHYDEKRYRLGPAPDYDQSCWLDVRLKLGLDFPDLPYFIDGDVKITQSNAILRYLGRKHDLCGHTEAERMRIDTLVNQATDARKAFIRRVASQDDTEECRQGSIETLRSFSDFLGSRTWFAGDNITFVDFLMYDVLEQYLQLEDSLLEESKNLQDFQRRFEELPPIKQYMTSPRFLSTPTNIKMAKFLAKQS
ncbi:glutathione S-transferase Mu 7-like [Panulirus ornatus]|uniref:glutathione S-transferase Mu 7-like n=1 Tax=Panulirus ornatus TaxID=150431 RepID=UPI003A835952